VCSMKLNSQVSCRGRWRCSQRQSDPQTFQEGKKRVKMATEGHEHGQEKATNRKETNVDLELIEIREIMEQLTLKMQQEAKVHWRYEWPLKRKINWPVQKLLE
jgi:hypothetical protein